MAYHNILLDLSSNTIIGPYKAIALKRPGEDRGVWLFGEAHEDGKREKGNIGDDVYIGDVIAKYADDAILFYEGDGRNFGCGLFTDAPADVKEMVSGQSDIEEYVECLLKPSEKDDISLDNEGNNIHRASEDDLEMWQDDEFWDETLEGMGDIDFIAEKFRSKGGIGVNIDRPIRNYIFNALFMVEIYGELDIIGYMSSVTWALNHISSSPRSIRADPESDISTLPFVAIGYINAFRNYIGHKFPMTVDGDIKEGMVSALVQMLKTTPEGLPEFISGSDDSMYRFTIALLMDLNVSEKIKFHSDKDIVVYAGAKHSVNQAVLLLKQGYVVEHYYSNMPPNEDISSHRLLPTHKKYTEFSYDTSVNFMQNIANIARIMDPDDVE